MSGPGYPMSCQPINPALAAVHRIAEHPFEGVLAQHAEELRGLDGPQPLVPLGRRKVREIAQFLDPLAVDLLRRRLALVAVLRHGFDEGRLGVAILVAPVGAGELPVD